MEKGRSAQEVQVNAADGSIVDSIESKIFNIRGKQVMLDRDLAVLYGVETKALNQAVKRNLERFPERFRFQLVENELNKLVTNCDRFKSLKHSTSMPYAFTEQGISMLATVLKSKTAIEMSIKIMDAFVAMRRFLSANAGLFQRMDSLERHQIETDQKIDHVLNCLEEGTLKEKAHIFSAGQIYEARSFIADLISKAKSYIILIDGYIGPRTIDLLDARADGVRVQIITHSINGAIQDLVDQYNVQFPNKPLSIRTWNVEQHDRWMIIDDVVWHCGASLKDVGLRTFGINSMGLDMNIIMMHI